MADAEKLAGSDCPRPSVTLENSPGGDVRAGMRIGRWIREHQATTSVSRDDRYCYSTCALIFIAGIDRINIGVIGLHRPYLTGEPQPAERIPELVSAMREDVSAYISEMGARPEFASVMLETLPEQMRVYHQDEIHELVAETDAVYDEMRVAEEAQRYGISTEEFRRRRQEAQQVCDLNRVLDGSTDAVALYEICRPAVFWGLTESVYLRRNESVPSHCGHLRESDPQEIRECRISVMRGN